MSIQETQKLACPSCKQSIEVEVFQSLNPSRQLDAVDSILENRMQTGTCQCGQMVRAEPEFIYMDLKNKLCIAAFPSAAYEKRKIYEEKAQTTFNKAFGAMTQVEGVRNRVTFGWPAFREKVLAQTKGISDVDLELAKIALIKESGEAPSLSTSLRLLEVTQTDLVLGWHENLPPYTVTSGLNLNKSILDHIRDNPENWAPLRNEMDQGLFIDLIRFFDAE